MFGIIGSGFGLYGHLPAIAEVFPNESILLPKRYCEVLESRVELRSFIPRIITVKDEAELLNSVDKLVISTWPSAQERFILDSFSNEKILSMVLEKPLATTPVRSEYVLRSLSESGRNFIINYSFLQCDWYKWLKEKVKNKYIQSIQLTWNFSAHHYKNNIKTWKRAHRMGGGIIRFYGIHLLATLSELGFLNTTMSQTEGFTEEDLFLWQANFQNHENTPFNVNLNSISELEEFSIDISYNEESTVQNEKKKLQNPFSEIQNPDLLFDPRVKNLKQLYLNLRTGEDCKKKISLYKETNSLWKATETINQNRINVKIML